MIYVTRLNHVQIALNSQLIEYVEATPDTIISLTNGEKLMVLESVEEIIARVVDYHRRIQEGCHGTLIDAQPQHSVKIGEPDGGR